MSRGKLGPQTRNRQSSMSLEVAMSRVQLALNVNDIDEAVSFYARLFGTEPAKRRPGYANFAITEPPLKLVLLENPGQGGTSTTSASKSPDTGAVEAEQARLAEAGLAAVDERDTTCCYARQDKFWVTAPPAASGGRSTPSWRTARPSGAKTASSAATRSRPSWTPSRPGGPAVLRRPQAPARRTPPPRRLLRLTAMRACERSPRGCHRWTARRCRSAPGSCRPIRPGWTA